MSSPERAGQNPEQDPVPYYQAARYPGEKPAGQAYFQAQQAIFETSECDLSAYRLQLKRIWHVAVLGELPPERLRERLMNILSAGEPVSIPTDALRILKELRDKAIKQAPWVERHYRPGNPL